MLCFDHVAHMATRDEVRDFSPHITPPEDLLQVLVHLRTSGVDGVCGSMRFLEDLLLEGGLIWHT